MKSKAFTLIELLVVIAIIAILAAILFPVFAQAKAAAKKTASLSDSKQLMLGSIMYATDFDDTFVENGWASPGDTGPNGGEGSTQYQSSWIMNTQPYLKNYGVLLDPLDPGGAKASFYDTSRAFNSGPRASFVVNSVKLHDCTGSPGDTIHLAGVIHNRADFTGNPVAEGSQTSTSIAFPAETILFAEWYKDSLNNPTPGAYDALDHAVVGIGASAGWSAWHEWNSLGGPFPGQSDGWFSGQKPNPAYPGKIGFGDGRGNFAYTDGHSKSNPVMSTVNMNATDQGSCLNPSGTSFYYQWDATRTVKG
jgi:prepilin-type N-terminal cleavage/methylation domain-containing protein/prepilin-type processing-associated H-X9-DG protein